MAATLVLPVAPLPEPVGAVLGPKSDAPWLPAHKFSGAGTQVVVVAICAMVAVAAAVGVTVAVIVIVVAFVATVELVATVVVVVMVVVVVVVRGHRPMPG